MEAHSATRSAEIVSLSAGQVESLLKSFELHHERLQAAQEDVRNLLVHGVRPGYVLDFELIFKYAFRAEERPDWAGEVQYLLDRPQVKLFTGPGTDAEIQKFIHAIGYVPAGEGGLIDVDANAGRERAAYGLEPETIEAGMARLRDLLCHPCVKPLPNRPYEPDDEKAQAVARLALDVRRGSPERAGANWADASNWAGVLQLRRHDFAHDPGCYPYLLTATSHLLEERSWDTAANAQVSRRPWDAIYTEVLFDSFPEPSKAMAHTRRMVFEAASLANELQGSPAYLDPASFREDPALDRAIEANLVGDELRRQLDRIAEFVKEPVVEETQRIYDNVRRASAGAARRQGVAPELLGGKSPRRLFDLIMEVSAALSAGAGSAVLGDLWRTALDLEVDSTEGRRSFCLTESSSLTPPTCYLSGDHYLETAGSEEHTEQYVLRWPTALDGDDLIEAFSRAYLAREVDRIDLVVGSDGGVESFEASLPLAWGEVASAVRKALRERDPGAQMGLLRWVRMGSSSLGLYADLCASDLTRAPLVGLFAPTLDPEQIEELYFRTSSRYLLPVWLRRALEEIQDGKS